MSNFQRLSKIGPEEEILVRAVLVVERETAERDHLRGKGERKDESFLISFNPFYQVCCCFFELFQLTTNRKFQSTIN